MMAYDEAGRLLGLVSRSDALRWRAAEPEDDVALAETVSDASLPVAYPDTPVGMVADLMIASGISRVPVVLRDGRVIVGILSRQDLLKARRVHRRAESERGTPHAVA